MSTQAGRPDSCDPFVTTATQSKIQRKLSKKKTENKAKASTIQIPAGAPIEDTTVCEPQQNFTPYVNERGVMAGSEWASPSSYTAEVKAKRPFLDSNKTLRVVEALFERSYSKRRSPKEKIVVKIEHNPRVVYGHPPGKFESLVYGSKSLSSIANSIKRLNPLHKAPFVPSIRDWDDRGKPNVFLTDDQVKEIGEWAEEQSTEYNEQGLVALTTRELKRLEGCTVDKIITAKSAYNVPPPTPSTSEAGDDDYGEWEMDENIFGSPDDYDPEAEHRYLHKDLRKLLGLFTGFHITPGSGCPSLFDENDNLSDFYCLPLIEHAVATGVEMDDEEDDEEDDDTTSLATSESSDYDQTQNVIQRPRSQVPAQAIIHYLLYKGMHIDLIAQKLGVLDAKFLYSSESRWWKRCRIPEHTQLNDQIIEMVMEVAKADELWWEREFDEAGKKMPTAMRIIQTRMREREVKKLAKKSLENYFWWRLRGETVHMELKRGPLLREGEY